MQEGRPFSMHRCVRYWSMPFDHFIKLFWRHRIDWRLAIRLRSIPTLDHSTQFPQRQLVNGSWRPFKEGAKSVDS